MENQPLFYFAENLSDGPRVKLFAQVCKYELGKFSLTKETFVHFFLRLTLQFFVQAHSWKNYLWKS
jgi:hypothetical protein